MEMSVDNKDVEADLRAEVEKWRQKAAELEVENVAARRRVEDLESAAAAQQQKQQVVGSETENAAEEAATGEGEKCSRLAQQLQEQTARTQVEQAKVQRVEQEQFTFAHCDVVFAGFDSYLIPI
jgi:predicted nuclease with TOPRIM domain